MKTVDITQYAVIKVIIHSFGHDSNGNPTAHHAIEAYREIDNVLGDVLYRTARRAWVGYSGRYEDYVPSALKRAGIDINKLTRNPDRVGGRAEGRIEIVYYTN